MSTGIGVESPDKLLDLEFHPCTIGIGDAPSEKLIIVTNGSIGIMPKGWYPNNILEVNIEDKSGCGDSMKE